MRLCRFSARFSFAIAFSAVVSHAACAYANIEENQNQEDHQVREADGSGFTAKAWWPESVGSGMAVIRKNASGGIQWSRKYDSQSINYHFSANRVPAGPIRVWHLGQTGSTESILRMLTVDAATGDSLATDTLYTDATQYLRGNFIATRDGGMVSCINSWSVNGARNTLFALRTDSNGKTSWTANLLDEAKARSGTSGFMFCGGIETEDGGYLIAIATTTINLGQENSDTMLLFRIDKSGAAGWLGKASDIPCIMAHNTKRMHYSGYALVPLKLSYAAVTGGPAMESTVNAWADQETAAGLDAKNSRNARIGTGPSAGLLRRAHGIGFTRGLEPGSPEAFGADGCRMDP